MLRILRCGRGGENKRLKRAMNSRRGVGVIFQQYRYNNQVWSYTTNIMMTCGIDIKHMASILCHVILWFHMETIYRKNKKGPCSSTPKNRKKTKTNFVMVEVVNREETAFPVNPIHSETRARPALPVTDVTPVFPTTLNISSRSNYSNTSRHEIFMLHQ